jgi:hypothetical protein
VANLSSVLFFIPGQRLTDLSACHWKPGMPVIYNLKTSLGVSYEGGESSSCIEM